jgi:hypothetical protein
MHASHDTARGDAQAAPTAALLHHGSSVHSWNHPSACAVGYGGASFEHMHASCSACHVANLLPTTTGRPGYIQRCCQMWAACSTPRPRDWGILNLRGRWHRPQLPLIDPPLTIMHPCRGMRNGWTQTPL